MIKPWWVYQLCEGTWPGYVIGNLEQHKNEWIPVWSTYRSPVVGFRATPMWLEGGLGYNLRRYG